MDNYKDTRADRNKMKLMICGGVSGGISRTIIAPFSRTSLLFQVQNVKNAAVPEAYKKGIFPALRSMFEREGYRGFFKGNGTHLLKKVPFAAIKFLSYERYKQIFTPRKQEDARVWRRLAAGGCSAMTAVLCTYPLDLVQTQLAVQTTKQRYTGIANTLTTVVRQEGLLQLYRGLSVTMISVVPYIALNMTIWENLKKFVSGGVSVDLIDPKTSAACGAVSGAIASTITFPLDVIRRHMQLNWKSATDEVMYFSYVDCVKKIFARDGIRGFYRGLLPHYWAVVPAVAISLGTYDLMKSVLQVK